MLKWEGITPFKQEETIKNQGTTEFLFHDSHVVTTDLSF